MTAAPRADDLRCLIVDDEAPARDELRFLLDEVNGVQVIGSAATAEEAAVLIQNVDYDICFFDIRMPGRTGLELAADLADQPEVPGQHRPEIIFTTAYPDHAVDAFELSAVDYLLKPFDAKRLEQAIGRVRERSSVRTTGDAPRPRRDFDASENTQRLPIERGDRTVFVEEDQIVAAAAARGYTYLHLSDERVLVRYTLAELEDRLSGAFHRVHRSYLANLNQLVELRADYKGGLVLVMNDVERTRIPVARRQANDVRRILGL